jgi:adenosine deaminase
LDLDDLLYREGKRLRRNSLFCASNLSRENVKYVEAFYSPGDYRDIGLSPQGITKALIRGRDRAYQDFHIKSQLIVDLVRDYGSAYGMSLVEELEDFLGKGVTGVGLGGNEDRFPADAYHSVYAEARKRGYRLTAHAGETAGARSIWAAIEKLGVERIGHGLRANEDERLVSFLKREGIPLEMCVTSNLRTGVCGSLETHPIRQYYEKGLKVTVNSDDPTMFDTSITKEYLTIARGLQFDLKDLRRVLMNGVEASFLPEKDKEHLKSDFQKQLDRQLGEE